MNPQFRKLPSPPGSWAMDEGAALPHGQTIARNVTEVLEA